VRGASAVNSILRREVVLEEDVEIEDCIIMDHTLIRRGSKLKRVIVDRFNVIDSGTRLGHDLEADRAGHFVSPSGIVVLPKGRYTPETTRFH
jgi:glucose-1-phosphate adenylyltransferase